MGTGDHTPSHRCSQVVPAVIACLVILILLAACRQPAPERALNAQATEAALAVILANAESTRASARVMLEWKPTEAPSTWTATVVASLTSTLSVASASLASPTPIPPSATLEFAQAVATTIGNVRAGPGTSYPAIGRTAAGQVYLVTGRSADDSWWQIEFHGRTGWVIDSLVTVRGNVPGVAVVEVAPPPTVAAATPAAPAMDPSPAPAVATRVYRCFTPKLRFYTDHKGCCGEILGEVRDLRSRAFAGAQIEVTVPNSSYRTVWPISSNGDYSITALSSGNPYAIRLVGKNIKSGSFDVRFGPNQERALVDFFEARCPAAAAPPQPTAAPVVALAGAITDEAGQPVAGARVAADDKFAETSAEGSYLLSGLAPGQVSVVVTRDGYDPYLSAAIPVSLGVTRTADFSLAKAGATTYPRDPMATNQVDPAGAATAADAERLARLQGFSGPVASISETTLTGEYIVNYRTAKGLRAAAAMLNHRAWQLVDSAGAKWYVIRVCGNLAIARPAALTIPVQCVAQSYPVFRCTRQISAHTCPAASCAVTAVLPAGWQGRIVGCSGDCGWLRLEGCGGQGECWVLATDGEVTGELGSSEGGEGRGGGLPRYRWTEPVQVSADSEGRMVALWEEHIFEQGPEHAYGPLHYRVFDGNKWSEVLGIPGSENHGEQLAATLADGSIIVTATSMEYEWSWFHWQGGRWSSVHELTLRLGVNEGAAMSIVGEGDGTLHLAGSQSRVWDGSSWQDTGRLGTVLWHAGVRDSQGRVHVFGTDFGLGAASQLAHWLWNGSAWKRVETVYDEAVNPSAAISSDDTMHLAWHSGSITPSGHGSGEGPHDAWVSYSFRGPDGWSAPQPVAAPMRLNSWTGFSFVDIAAMPDGNVAIAYELGSAENRGTIHVVWGRDGTWSEPVVFTPPAGYDFAFPGIGVDTQGRIHVLWSTMARLGVWYAMGTPED